MLIPLRILVALAALVGSIATAASENGPATVDKGQLDGALYVIVKPRGWNGKLLLYQHGLRDSALPLSVEINTKNEPYKSLASEGWMIAASSYRRNGVIVRDAIEDVGKLHQHIVVTHGKPKQTFLMGSSMGGAITIRLIEADRGRLFNGAIVLGTALTMRDADLPELSFSPKVPVIFMTNQSEIGQSADYVKRAAKADVNPALWIVERDGHIKFAGGEYIEALKAIDRWAAGDKIEMERKFVIAGKEPPSTARFADGGAYGTIREFGGGFGNLLCSFVEADLKKLGIAMREVFQADIGGKTYEVTYANTYSDVPRGKWVCFKDGDGYCVVAINFGNAAQTADAKEGDAILIRKHSDASRDKP